MQARKIDKKVVRKMCEFLGKSSLRTYLLFNCLNISIDGSDVKDISIDGQNVKEVTVDGTTVWTTQQVLEDFENGDLSNYSGDTGAYSVTSNGAYEGSYGLVWDGSTDNAFIKRTDVTVSQGQTFEARIRSQSANKRTGLVFGLQDSGFNGYTAGHQTAGSSNSMELTKDYYNDSGTTLADSSVSPPENEWMRIEVTWKTNGDIIYILEDSSGNQVDKLTANDTTYTSGHIGWHARTGGDTGEDMRADYVRVIG